MAELKVTKVSRNLTTKPLVGGLEWEDLGLVLFVGAIMQVVGGWFDRLLFGISLTVLLQFGVPALVLLTLYVVKYGRQPGFLFDFIDFQFRPKTYSGRAKDKAQTEPYLRD